MGNGTGPGGWKDVSGTRRFCCGRGGWQAVYRGEVGKIDGCEIGPAWQRKRAVVLRGERRGGGGGLRRGATHSRHARRFGGCRDNGDSYTPLLDSPPPGRLRGFADVYSAIGEGKAKSRRTLYQAHAASLG